MKNNPVALIFSTVWPEPNSSAAGVRQFQWIRILKSLGYQIYLSSPSREKSESDWGALPEIPGVSLLPLPLNQEQVVRPELQKLAPSLVLFDRFILEEQFGHLIYEYCPQALVLVETQDLHFVRKAREAVKDRYLEMKTLDSKFYQTETAIREFASIERVDHAFVVSSFEADLLERDFQLSNDQVTWLPFAYEIPLVEAGLKQKFHERKNFVWIGNFRHGPNVDGLRWFRQKIWPLIRKALPEAKFQIYGAYPTKEVSEWDGNGIEIKGSAETLDEVFLRARVNLAPLRYGAGIKGKIIEGFRYGLPVVTTKIGAEGFLATNSNFAFPGSVENELDAFARACISLYQDEGEWNSAREQAVKFMESWADEKKILPTIQAQVKDLVAKKASAHLPTWRSKVLRSEFQSSHRYFSKWIEAKETAKKDSDKSRD